MISKALHQKYQIQEPENTNFLPGVSALGSGYNVFGEYANPRSITYQLFDWQEAETKTVIFDSQYVVPEQVNTTQLEGSNYIQMSGTSIEKFESNLNVYTKLGGGYSFFSGSLSANYASNELRNSRNEFTHTQQDIQKWSLIFSIDEAKSLLKSTVKSDIAELEPTLLFDKYGTHILTGIIVGGKSTYHTATDQVDYQSGDSLEFISELSYESLTFQISAQNKASYSSTISSFQSHTSSELHTLGGSAELGGSNILVEGGFKEWSLSVGNNPVFIDFANQNPLTPIWELCEDETRKQTLEDAYATFAEQETRNLIILSNSITAVDVISGDTSEIQASPGFTKVGYDLNKNAKGKFIYVCYKESTAEEIANNNLAPLVGLDVVIGDSDDVKPPEGYIKITQDLNQGHGGKFIYLCYKNGTAGDTTSKDIIKDIIVIGASYSQVYPPNGFTKIDKDCNKGVGGNYIYICYSTTV